MKNERSAMDFTPTYLECRKAKPHTPMCSYTLRCTGCTCMDLTHKGGRTSVRLMTAVFLGEGSSFGGWGRARRSFSFLYTVSSYCRKPYPSTVHLIKKKERHKSPKT